jgi:Fe-S cluster assembly ATP-binding protein
MFQIQKLSVKKGKNELLKEISLSADKGEGVVVFGPNGCGKSTLFKAIMGLGEFDSKGKISLQGKNIMKMDIQERVKLGIGYMYQTPPLVKGVELSTLLANQLKFDGDVNGLYEEMSDDLKALDMEYLFERDINVGLSGGEIKRSELLTLSVLENVSLYLLDEPDSGVDIENVKRLGEYISKMVEGKSYLLVTHSGEILKYLNPEIGVVMIGGEIVYEGGVEEILKEVQKNGYSKFSKETE